MIHTVTVGYVLVCESNHNYRPQLLNHLQNDTSHGIKVSHTAVDTVQLLFLILCREKGRGVQKLVHFHK